MGARGDGRVPSEFPMITAAEPFGLWKTHGSEFLIGPPHASSLPIDEGWLRELRAVKKQGQPEKFTFNGDITLFLPLHSICNTKSFIYCEEET